MMRLIWQSELKAELLLLIFLTISRSFSRPTGNPKWHSAQTGCISSVQCVEQIYFFSKSIRVIWFEREVVVCGNVVSKEKMVNLLLVLPFNLNPIWISLSVRPNSSERTIAMNLNPKNNNPRFSKNAPCWHTNTCPVNEHAEEQQRTLHPPRGLKGHRSGPGVWTDAVRRWRASTGWREQDPADTDGTDRCGMMFGLGVGAGCCQDREQLNPPSERRQPLLGRPTPPSSLPSEVRFANESLFWNGSLYWFGWTDSQRVRLGEHLTICVT